MPLRVSRCFFIVSLLSGSEGFTASLVREVSRVYGSRKEGLTKESDYVAVINHSKKFPSNRWLLCGDQSSTPVTPVTSSKSHVNHMTWDSLQDAIVESLNEHNIELDETALAGEIHDLLDNVPWELEDYILFDVIVIVPESLSPTISLFGALWRLKKWHNSSLYFLTNDNNSYSSIWIEWSECLQAEIGSLSNLTQNTLTLPIIWRGSLYIQKRRRDSPNLPHPHLTELSDFKLLLRQPVASVGGNDDLCISASAHPSHLELVQLINMNQVPLLFLSGVPLQLYIGSSSFPVFHQLFQLTNSQSNARNTTGVLLRLCYREPTKVLGQSQKKTSEWKNFVLEQEKLADSSPLVSGISVGPLLLVPPQHSSSYTDDTHYDAWLLNQPQSLPCTSFSDLLQDLQTYSCSSNDCNDFVLKDLPLLNSSQNLLHSSSFVDDHFDVNCNTEPDLLCAYSCPELAAITVLEDQLKKKIKRTNTCDLTLGGVVAPPPSGSLSAPVVGDIIDCFDHNGEPLSDLVPVAMEDNNGLSIHMIDPETASSVSYKKILSSTPTRARRYHGVNYCLSEEDKLKEAKLLKVQERCIPRERSCHCSTAETPSKELKKIQQRRLLMSGAKDTNVESEKIDGKTCEKELEPGQPAINEESSTIEVLKNDTTADDNVNYSSELIVPVPQSTEEVTDATVAESNEDCKSKEKKKRKKYMETCIVSSLKACNMNRSHSRFKACYQKCFKISKLYIKDLNASSDVRKQIKKIVENTVHQVVEFELEQANRSL